MTNKTYRIKSRKDGVSRVDIRHTENQATVRKSVLLNQGCTDISIEALS